MKGVIALDIDGTITKFAASDLSTLNQSLDFEIVTALHELVLEGWKIVFITGRPFPWSFQTLEFIPFPYCLAVQNGALLIEMPSQKILIRNSLSNTILPQLESIRLEQKTDFVLYSGKENDDLTYYRPSQLPPLILEYVLQRSAALGEKWRAVIDYSSLPISFFSSIKFFAKENEALRLIERIENFLELHAPLNRDPFNPDYYVIQVTHSEATKGKVLKKYLNLIEATGPLIVAGDDLNDRSMLEIADIKIVMDHAPLELQKMAHIIAPSADKKGIILGLTQAINRFNP